jgi:uncharacterized protein
MKMLAQLLLAVFVVSLTSVASFAFDVPALNGRVNDNAGLLTAAQRMELTDALRALEEKTTVQIAILIVKDLQDADIKSFALKVAETWKLGQKGKDNGLLLMYTVKEDRYRFEVGYGLEGAIPDSVAGSIIRHQLRAKADPKHGTNDFGAAFKGAIEKVSAIVTREFAKDPTGESMKKPPAAPSEGVLIILVIAAIAGFVQKYAGAVIGGVGGASVAYAYALGPFGFVALMVLATVIGYFGTFFLSTAGKIGVAMGSSNGSSSSGSSSSDGFSGGGGSFGGGGADG